MGGGDFSSSSSSKLLRLLLKVTKVTTKSLSTPKKKFKKQNQHKKSPCSGLYPLVYIIVKVSSHADTHLLSDRGDTSSTSTIWLYKQQDLEKKDYWIISDKAVCRTANFENTKKWKYKIVKTHFLK